MTPRTRLLHFSGLLIGVIVWLANASNPPNGCTGAPFDTTCGACHGGGNYNGNITIDGLPGSISPNVVYPLTITMTPTSGNPNRGGFQLVVVDDNNTNSGNLANSNAQSGTEFFGGREYLDQRGAKVFGGNPISWSFNWTAPASAAGNMVNFYFIGNFCNGTGSTDGDAPITDFIAVPFGGGGGPTVNVQISSSTNVSCFGGNNGSATATATGGTPPLTYTWSNGQTQPTAVNLTAGTYTVTVAGGSTATASVVITQPTAINASASVSGQITCNTPSVNVTATVSGGTPPYTYAWGNGDTFNPASYTTIGASSVTITDNNGCVKTANFTVTGNTALPIASAAAPAAFSCASPTMTLSGAGSSTGANISYIWQVTGGGTIVSGGTTLSPTVSGCGTYTLQVRNNTNGCTSTASVTPTCNIVLPNLTASGNNLTCAVSSVPISASSTTPGVTYAWVGPNGFTSTQAMPTVSTAGTYTVTATNPANGCTRSATVTVGTSILPPGATAVGGTLTCAAASITLQSNSPTTGVTYAWSGPNSFTSNVQNPAVTTPGTYTLTVTNPVNGCSSSTTTSVSQNITPPGAAALGGTITCATPSVALSGSSPTNGVTYAWSGPNGFFSGQQNPVVAVVGTYTLTVANPTNGCTSTATAAVTGNLSPPSGVTATGGTLTCAATAVTLSGTSTTPNATFSWTGPNGYTAALQNPSVSVAGTYTLVVLSPTNGCTTTATAVVNVNTVAPGSAAAAGNTLTCANPTATLNGSSPTAGVTYAWSGPGGFVSTLQNPVASVAGTYTLVVRNPVNGCTSSSTITVLSDQATPSASAVGGTLTCAVPSITLSGTSATSGVTFSWAGPNGYTATQANPVVTVPGNYTLTVLNPSNGCTATATVVVNANTTPPNLAITTGQLTCTTTSVQICANSTTPGVTIHWVGPNGFSASVACPTVNVAGTYTATVTNPVNGCTVTGQAQVTSNTTPPTVGIATPDSLHCNATTVAINASGSSQGPNFSFSWTTTTGNIQSGANTPLPLVTAAGTYNLLITNSTNGCTATGSTTVVQIAPLVATATATPVACNGGASGTAMATYNGGIGTVSYVWNNGATTAALSGLLAGTYTVTLTDAKQCTASTSILVSQPTPLAPNVTATQQTLAGVNDGTATAAPTGGTPAYSYLWNTGQTTATIANLAPGSYTVTVRDANNCTALQTANVNAVNCNLSATIAAVNVSCHGAANGSAAISVAGANGSTAFAWSNNATTAAIGNLLPGTYTVTATDALHCSQVQNVTIAEPPVLEANAMATAQTIVGQNNGTASATPSGGTPPYVYLWSNNQTTAAISGLAPGTYSLLVTDNKGCTAVQTVSVAAVTCALAASLSTEAVSCFGGSNGSATATVNGANGVLSYQWSNGATTLAISGLMAGAYTVTATDASACTTTATGLVTQPQPLQAVATVLSNVNCPLDATGQVAVNASGGTAPYTITLPTATPTGYAVGAYTAIATDAHGCSATTRFTIISTDTQAPSITCPLSATACVQSTVFYSQPIISDNCSPGPQLALISGQPSGSVFNVGVTTQVFRATDGSGNSATCSFSVTVNPLPTITFTAAPDTNNIGQGTIRVALSGGSAPFMFTWLKDGQFYSNEKDLNNLSAGVYQLEVTDVNGCRTTPAPITILNVVGSEEPSWLAALKLYPNPASAVLHLETGEREIDAAQILTPQGRLMQTINPADGFKDIPVGSLTAGMYYLQLRTKEGWQVLLKWVKAD